MLQWVGGWVKEKRKLLLRSGFIKENISKSINSASVPQYVFWEGPSTKVRALHTYFSRNVSPV